MGSAETGVKLALTVPEAARAIGVSGRQVYNLAKRNGLPMIKVGGRRLVRVADLARWIEAQSDR